MSPPSLNPIPGVSRSAFFPVLTQCAVWLFNVFLLGLLGVQVVVLASVFHHGELVVPEFAMRWLEKRFEQRNIRFSCAQAEVDIHGNLLLSDVRLGSTDYSDSVLEAERVLVRFFPWALLWGSLHPEALQVANVNAYMPAVLSPTGMREKTASGISLEAFRTGADWRIHRLHGRVAGVEVRLAGTITPRKLKLSLPLREKPPPEPLEWKPFLDTLAAVEDRFKEFDDMRVVGDFATREDGVHLTSVVHWDAMSIPEGVRAGPGAAFVSLVWHSAEGAPRFNRPPDIRMEQAVIGEHLRLGRIEARIFEDAGYLFSGGFPDSVGIWLAGMVWKDLELESLHGEINLDSHPAITGVLGLKNDADWAEFHGEADWTTRRIHGELCGELNPLPYLESLNVRFRGLELLSLPDPVSLNLEFDFGEGGEWKSAAFRAWLDRADFDGLAITRGYVRGRASPKELYLDDGDLATERYRVSGSYYQNLETQDYRYLLDGRVHPRDLNRFIKEDWWDTLWERFSFGDDLPEATLDLRGRYRGGRTYSHMYGHARLDDFQYHGVPVDSASTLLWQHAGDFSLINLALKTPEGAGLVHLQWRHQPGGGLRSLAFVGSTRLPLAQAAQIIGEESEPYFALFTPTAPPVVKIFGVALLNEAEETENLHLNLAAHIDNPVTFKDYHFDKLDFHARVKPGEVNVANATFGLAGGEGSGWVRFAPDDLGPRLSLGLSLEAARYAGLLDAVPLLRGLHPGVAEHAEAPPGLVDGELKLDGIPGNVASFTGRGKGVLREASLGRLHLFWVFSHFLKELGLPLGVIEFTGAESPFELAEGYIHLSDLEITGPTARISAHGNVGIEDQSLELSMNLYPLGGLRIPVLSELLRLINPVSNSLELQINGTIEDPRFSAAITPLRAITGRQQHIEPGPPERN